MAFAIYVRVSEVGEREGPSFGSPEEQESAAREWAERVGVEVEAVPVIELDVSGATAVADRELGRLIERCESGELEGIIVRYEDRFARDVIEGATALRRIEEAGARLIATASGFDSQHITPDKRAWFTMQMAFGQAQREKNREARLRGAQRAADRGIYLASSAPLGYDWIDRPVRRYDGKLGAGKLVPDKKTGPLVRELFERRAAGESLRSLAAWLREKDVKITKSGVRVVLANRAYLGEATVPTSRKGEVEVRRAAHAPLVTPEQFELAQAAGGTYHPRNGKWSGRARLTGIARCSGCMKPLSPHGGGKKKDTGYYSCTSEDCPQRVAIKIERLDEWAEGILQDAVMAGCPEVVAVLEGDDRHARALEAVNVAARELEEYRRVVKVSEVGAEAWKRDVASRQEALALARRALAEIPAPRPVSRGRARNLMTWHEAEPALDRERNARFIDRIIVLPVGRGNRVPVGERAEIWFVGAAEAWDAPEVEQTVTDEQMAALRASVGMEGEQVA